jgi:hypothetical protein
MKVKPTAAARPSAAEKGGSGVSSATVQLARTPKKAEPSAAARPSASVKGASPLDYDTTQHAYAHNETKRSGEAKKSSEGLPLTATLQLANPSKKPNAATTPSAEKGGALKNNNQHAAKVKTNRLQDKERL